MATEVMGWDGVWCDVLARSDSLHFWGAQVRSEAAILSAPVVHWHLMSDRPQPEPWMAVAKQGICLGGVSKCQDEFFMMVVASDPEESERFRRKILNAIEVDWDGIGRWRERTAQLGTLLKSWAAAKAKVAAKATTEKRMLIDVLI